MKIAIVCSDQTHPVYQHLETWCRRYSAVHDINIATKLDKLPAAEILFLVSCSEIVRDQHRAKFGHIMVLHASDLPEGKGWSPYVWDILAGKEQLTLSLIDAADPVDSGAIWAKKTFHVDKNLLWDEINELLFTAELSLMNEAIELVKAGASCVPQETSGETWHRKRTQKDSELDPAKSIAEQFDLLRICDPNRYPAHLEFRGSRYKITIERMPDDPS